MDWGQGGVAVRWSRSGGITLKLSLKANARSLSLKFENARLVSNVAPSSAGLKQPALIMPSRPDKKALSVRGGIGRQPKCAVSSCGTDGGRKQSRWLSHPGGFAVSESANNAPIGSQSDPLGEPMTRSRSKVQKSESNIGACFGDYPIGVVGVGSSTEVGVSVMGRATSCCLETGSV